jgi:AcrR family transcriptional regulator
VETVVEAGYPSARVGDIAARAGVSRATFYQLFENKQACFLAAHEELSERLSAKSAVAIAAGGPAGAIDAAFAVLVDTAREEPLAYTFLTHEAMLAGPGVLAQRDRLISTLAEQVEDSQDRMPGAGPFPDLPASILIGGLVRVLGMRVRRGAYDSQGLLDEMILWVDCYRVRMPAGSGPAQFALADLSYNGELVAPGAMAPPPLPRGRHRLPSAVVARVQRERILYATAEVIRLTGYEEATVADIVAAAGLSREAFYSHFHNRSEAFVATHELIFAQMMATASGAFIASPGAWPDRVWDAWVAETGLVVSSASLAHFAFVESYALGRSIARRTDEAILAFTLFLRDGHRYARAAVEPSPTITASIAGAVMESTSQVIRHGHPELLFRSLPLFAYMILAPFLGADGAREFVQAKLGEQRAEHSTA